MSEETGAAWVEDAIFYQVFPDRFARSERVPKPRNLEPWGSAPTLTGYQGGDLRGVAERLDWLVALGVNAIYFNPIFRSASNHRYHTHDYLVVDPLLGGDEAFEEMLGACKARGIRVVLDGVFNHVSRGFFQFHDLLESGASSPWVDWFLIQGWPLRAYGEPGQDLNYAAWWNMPALPKLNTDNPEVREYLMQVAEHWTRRGIDGWRLDVPNEIGTPGFWEEFARRVRGVRADAYLVGEIWGDATEWIASGSRFDGTMNYVFASAVLRFVAGDRIPGEAMWQPEWPLTPPLDARGFAAEVDALLARYPRAARARNLNLLGSHDTPRLLTLAGEDADAVVLAACLLFTFPGAPCVYYGDEIGMSGGRDPACRGAFPWDDESSWDRRILDAFRSLGRLRAGSSALRRGELQTLWPEPGVASGMLHAFARDDGEQRIVVAVNAGPTAARAPIRIDGSELLWGAGVARGGEISLPPRSAGIWRER